MKEIELFIDGASQGNPGPSGIGVVICNHGETIKNLSTYIGNTTNNVAEYTALIYALQEAVLLKAEKIKVNTDSQLLYRQLNKSYKVKSPNIAGLYNQALRLLSTFKEVTLMNIPRQENKGADKLATLAIKQQMKKNRSLIKSG